MASKHYRERSRQNQSLKNSSHRQKSKGSVEFSHPIACEANSDLRVGQRHNTTQQPQESDRSSRRQKTRTISVPVGLKDILNDLSKEQEEDGRKILRKSSK